MSSYDSETQQLLTEAFAECDRYRQEVDNLNNEKQRLLVHIDELERELQTHRDNWALHPLWHGEPVDGDQAASVSEPPESRILLSKEAYFTLQSASSNQREEFEQELRKLCVPEIRRNQSKPIRGKKTDCMIFPQGDKAVRIFYYEHSDGSVRVCELADHRDSSYDRLIDQRKVFKGNYGEDGFTVLELFRANLV